MYPILNKIIISKNTERLTVSGLVIPEGSDLKLNSGTVIACGRGTKKHPVTVKAGDSIMYTPNTELEVEYKEIKCTVVFWENVICKL